MLKDKPYAALGIEMLKVLPSVAKSVSYIRSGLGYPNQRQGVIEAM